MRKSVGPESVALTGADCFLRAFDAEVRHCCDAGHLAQLVLRMGPGFSPDAFVRLLREVAGANPIMRAPIRRRSGIGPPEFRLSRAAAVETIPIEMHRGIARSDVEPAEPFVRRLNSTMSARNGRLFAADIVTYPDSSADVAITWLHLLLDGAGSERFIEHLSSCSQAVEHNRAIALNTNVATATGTLRERANQASAWHAALLGKERRRIISPSGPLTRTPQRLSYRWQQFDREQTATIRARSRRFAGLLTPMLFYLAMAIRGHQAVARNRNCVPEKWLVPLPVNLRPKGDVGETFRSHVALIWFHATPHETRDLQGLVNVLKDQRLATIKGGLIDAGVAAMDFVRLAPTRLFTKLARRDYDGELCSFFFAFTDTFAPEARHLCGADIETGSHVPSVPPSPGSNVVASLRDDRLTLTQIRQQGALSDEEDEILRTHMRDDLLGL